MKRISMAQRGEKQRLEDNYLSAQLHAYQVSKDIKAAIESAEKLGLRESANKLRTAELLANAAKVALEAFAALIGINFAIGNHMKNNQENPPKCSYDHMCRDNDGKCLACGEQLKPWSAVKPNPLIKILSDRLTQCHNVLRTFREELTSGDYDAAEMFRGADSAMYAAALERVLTSVLAQFKERSSDDETKVRARIISRLNSNLLAHARAGVNASSSACSNAMSRYQLAAMSEVMDMIN